MDTQMLDQIKVIYLYIHFKKISIFEYFIYNLLEYSN